MQGLEGGILCCNLKDSWVLSLSAKVIIVNEIFATHQMKIGCQMSLTNILPSLLIFIRQRKSSSNKSRGEEVTWVEACLLTSDTSFSFSSDSPWSTKLVSKKNFKEAEVEKPGSFPFFDSGLFNDARKADTPFDRPLSS